MLNSDLLKQVIADSGVSTAFLCRKLGCSRAGFYNKLNEARGSVFNIVDVVILTEALHLTTKQRDDIFFGGGKK